MKEKKKTMVVLVLLLLVGLTSGYIARTYAKYASEVNKSGKAAVAKWNFTEDNAASEFTIMLNKTYTERTLVNGKIAPGTEGYFDIGLTNTSDTGVNYTIKLKDLENVPTNLKFYNEAGQELAFTTTSEDGTEVSVEGETVSGTLDAKTGTGTAKIKWKWEYEAPTSAEAAAKTKYDEDDTANGIAAKDMTVKVVVIGVQVEPEVASETAIPVTPQASTSPVAP